MFDLHFIDLVQLKCLALSNGVLRLETDDGRSGAIYFRRGQICHALTGALEGAAAFKEIATWVDWHLSETDLPIDLPATINVPWPDLLLPIARRLAKENKQKAAAATPPQSKPIEPAGKKVLIVDDTEMLLIFVADTLATSNLALQIVTASTGAEGIRLAATASPDLILLDYSLTDMTGDKVCQALLENAATARIPVLMMSGHLSELARTARNYPNVAAALAKPFLSGALTNEVERLLSPCAAGDPAGADSVGGNALPRSEPEPAPENPVPLHLCFLRVDCPGSRPHRPSRNPCRRARRRRRLRSLPLHCQRHRRFRPPLRPSRRIPHPRRRLRLHPHRTDMRMANPRPHRRRRVRQGLVVPATGELREKAVAEPPKSATTVRRTPAPRATPSSSFVSPTEVSVTLSEVVSMQLTPSFRMEAATLQPCNPVVSVKMDERSDLRGVPLENGFASAQSDSSTTA